MDQGLAITKGHGTQNDFVLVPDPAGRLDLSPSLIRALCDRRSGVGADGLIRVVRSEALADGVAQAGQATWFMDYSNADGSSAQMCGNGIRVFVAYLLRERLADLDDGKGLTVGTRSGPVRVRLDGDLLAAELGEWRVDGGSAAAAAGGDVSVSMPGDPGPLPGLRVSTGNPHVVVAVGAPELLDAVDLRTPPRIDPALPHGANVEVVVPTAEGADARVGHLLMRVHERGVGETRSCGSGAVAAVIAAGAWAGENAAPSLWWVDVPGGRLRVRLAVGDRFRGDRAELAGPAALVADGWVHPDWLAAAGSRT